jgi:hypothetical protein
MSTRSIVTTVGLLTLAMTMHAQELERVSVPFDFSVGGQNLPASAYEISRVETMTPEMLSVRNLDDQSQTELVLAKTNATVGEPKLLFDRYGGKYFLVGIVTQDGSYDLPHSQAEQRLSHHAALRIELPPRDGERPHAKLWTCHATGKYGTSRGVLPNKDGSEKDADSQLEIVSGIEISR